MPSGRVSSRSPFESGSGTATATPAPSFKVTGTSGGASPPTSEDTRNESWPVAGVAARSGMGLIFSAPASASVMVMAVGPASQVFPRPSRVAATRRWAPVGRPSIRNARDSTLAEIPVTSSTITPERAAPSEPSTPERAAARGRRRSPREMPSSWPPEPYSTSTSRSRARSCPWRSTMVWRLRGSGRRLKRPVGRVA